uniref:SLC12 domain-containing protein n=1 Tax=Ascaris lumbricoides TaxID=6252 RepID=A0A0M3HIA7_ASCLU
METVIQGARMRVFTISTSSRTMEQEQRSMAALLSKFRIDFSDVSVIPDIGRKPKAQTIIWALLKLANLLELINIYFFEN